MKYDIQRTSSFKRDYKLIKKRGYDISKLKTVITIIAEGNEIPATYRDHALSGNWLGYRELHIEPDWLLVYRIYENQLILSLTRTGTNSDLNF